MKPTPSQKALGLSKFFLKQTDAPQAVARVIGHAGGQLHLLRPDLSETWAPLSGKLAHEEAHPQVGDFVVAPPGEAVSQLLERQNRIARWSGTGRDGAQGKLQVLAANVDYALIIAALGPELNLRRIERYLTLAFAAEIQPVVLLNKADLVKDPQAAVAQVAALAPGLAVLAASASEGYGLEPLELYMEPGKTLVLLGSSGVGKSTLTNHLIGQSALETQATGAQAKGRHTTVSRHLFRLESGAFLLDQPGLRELLPEADPEALSQTYSEVDALIQDCRFGDCSHQSEPGCAVQAALERGELDPGRWAGYLSLQQDLMRQQARQTKAGAAQAKAEEKRFRRMCRNTAKLKQHHRESGLDH